MPCHVDDYKAMEKDRRLIHFANVLQENDKFRPHQNNFWLSSPSLSVILIYNVYIYPNFSEKPHDLGDMKWQGPTHRRFFLVKYYDLPIDTSYIIIHLYVIHISVHTLFMYKSRYSSCWDKAWNMDGCLTQTGADSERFILDREF